MITVRRMLTGNRVNTRLRILLGLGQALAGFAAQEGFPAKVPDDLRIPDAQKFIFQAHGTGYQIYACQAVKGEYTWTLKGPDANLKDGNGHLLGRHFGGPTWEATDGSRVVGTAVASVPSPNPDSIPWLRVNAIRHDGKGAMNKVVTIQRLNTKGGKAAETGCDVKNAGAETRVAYEADYYFYESSD